MISKEADNRNVVVDDVCSVTVTWNPNMQENKLIDQIRYLAAHVRHIIVVDNGSKNYENIKRALLEVPVKIEFIKFKANLGVAKALNVGIKRCLKYDSCKWILTMDQDTIFNENTFLAMSQELLDVNERGKIGVIGFNYTKLRFNKKILRNKTNKPKFVKSVITSGMLIRSEVAGLIQFDECLFAYFVDDDFCERVRKAGYGILRLFKSRLEHKEGERRIRGGAEYFYIEPSRLFLISRNSIIMFKRHGTLYPFLYSILAIIMTIYAGISIKEIISSSVRGYSAGLSLALRNSNQRHQPNWVSP